MTKNNRPVRLRFAPSPTGALHIGGVRTALFNYLYAKRLGGAFILRVEDTDQNRFVPGAEAYIMRALTWAGLLPDESPAVGGPHAPYRQSERKPMYRQYAERLLASGHAYYAFDSAEDLELHRKAAEAEGKTFKYDAQTRGSLNNSLNISQEELSRRLQVGQPYVIRIKLPADEVLRFEDEIRGEVKFQSRELDDKVLLKEDGMPTYHLANVVDDYLMEISHVVRGEEWLPSTPLHVYLYRYLGWEDRIPVFAHLPLILRPDGKGKLSKRDAEKYNMPVFPLDWPELNIKGFDGYGFLPEALVNFLALLGWTPAGDREILSIQEMVHEFDLNQVHKSGARFDFDKARWFNQQYLIRCENEKLASMLLPRLSPDLNPKLRDLAYLSRVCGLLKERVHFLAEIPEQGKFFFSAPDLTRVQTEQAKDLDKKVLKNWDEAKAQRFENLIENLSQNPDWTRDSLHDLVQVSMQNLELKAGEVFPFLRLALSGSLQGPDLFDLMAVLGEEEVYLRLNRFAAWCSTLKNIAHSS